MRNTLKQAILFFLIFVMLLPLVPIQARADAITDPDAVMMDDVLKELKSDDYRRTYEALCGGAVIGAGSSDDYVKGFLKALDNFDEDVDTKSKVKDSAIESLKHVQSVFGLTETESLDLDAYKELLFCLLIYKKPEEAKALLVDDWDYLAEEEYNYIVACAHFLRGECYQAKLAFENCSWGDSTERALACASPWPETGVVWQASSHKGSHKLSIKVEGEDYNWAEVFLVYDKTKKKHVATLFIGANGTATVKLPSGKYYITHAFGQTWYGKEDLFGTDVDYPRMEFSDGTSSFTIDSASFNITLTR